MKSSLMLMNSSKMFCAKKVHFQESIRQKCLHLPCVPIVGSKTSSVGFYDTVCGLWRGPLALKNEQLIAKATHLTSNHKKP
jgi:hypothetical protein